MTGRTSGLAAKGQRFGRIDSIRGFAALSVAIFHSIHVFSVHGADRIYLLKLSQVGDWQVLLARIALGLFNGNAAVSLFFVISGFVLAHSILRSRDSAGTVSGAFLMKRFVRLYGTMAIALVIYFLAQWFAAVATPALFGPPSTASLVANLLLIEPELMQATWSLFIEIGVAPIFIVMMLLVRRFGILMQIACLSLAIIWLFTSSRWFPGPWVHYPLNQFFFMFALGAAVSFAEPLVARLDTKLCLPVLAVSFLLLGFARGIFGYASRWSLLFEGLAGAIIVGIIAYHTAAPALRALDNRVVRWLGRISYSFYLYHPVIFLLCLPFAMAAGLGSWPLAPLTSGAIVAVLTIVPTAVLAYASYRWTELPSMALCARVDAWCRRSVEGRAQVPARGSGPVQERM